MYNESVKNSTRTIWTYVKQCNRKYKQVPDKYKHSTNKCNRTCNRHATAFLFAFCKALFVFWIIEGKTCSLWPEHYNTRPHDTRPHNTRPHDTRPHLTAPGQTRRDQTKQDQTRPDQTRPDQTRPHTTHPTLQTTHQGVKARKIGTLTHHTCLF